MVDSDFLANMPTARDVETSAAVLYGQARQLVRWDENEQTWEAPQGGPPAPGAVEAAQGYIKVAMALEGLTGPLRDFEAHLSDGGSPMDFLMGAMAGGGAIGPVPSE